MKKVGLIYLLFGTLLIPNLFFGFTFTVTPTDESCSGNGTLTFNPSNVDPNGSITYIVYKLPDLTTPLTTLANTFLGGLNAGNYRVIATETVGATATTQQVDVVINNNIVPLAFTVESVNQVCSSTSNIIVITTSGIGVFYEIFDGPVLFPLQAANTFTGLPVGTYKIRVFDNCGNGLVSTFTVTLNTIGLNISPPAYSNTSPQSCVAINVQNTITPATGTVIGYPLDIVYTVNPPNGGAPIVSNVQLNDGNLLSQPLSTVITLYNNQVFNYSITITDACGSVFTNNFIVDFRITLSASTIPIVCGDYFLKLNTTNFTPPYSLNFTNSPAGFVPSAFNANYPGPYNQSETYFGSVINPMPIGDYEVTITDFCGRTLTLIFTIVRIPPIPSGTGSNNGCLTNNGQLFISIPDYQITSAIITQAPSNYPFTTPHDVSAALINGTLNLNPLPLGNYTFLLTDECNDIIPPYEVNVPDYVDKGLSFSVRPGCDSNNGAVSVSSLNGKLTSITITQAPVGFTTPFNGNLNIAPNGIFYMNNFLPGDYTFSCVDECNFSNTITVSIPSYTNTASFSLQANCGSFNIPLNYESNGTISRSFWLQKLISPNVWGDPQTGVIYIEGSVPNDTNSYPLQNNTTNLNLSFNGIFRIITSFNSFNNGSEINAGTVANFNKSCIEKLQPELTFNESFEILTENRMPCSLNGSLDVIISAIGPLPLHYKITEKDGLPFIIDNGTSNVFVNLPIGNYKYVVEDNCGNIHQDTFNVLDLLSLVNILNPLGTDILNCQDVITGNETFDLTSLNSTILGPQSPTDYTVTFFTSLNNAQTNSNPIASPTNFNPTTNPQTIVARVIFNQLPLCYQTTTFDVIVGQNPSLLLNSNYVDCSTSPITLDASAGNLDTTTYIWSDGTNDTTGYSITISDFGVTNLTVTATNTYGIYNKSCSSPPKAITVTISQLPEIDRFETVDWTENQNSIIVFTTNNGAFEYSIDDINYQDSPTFSNLMPGLYTVYVKDKQNCGMDKKEVWLLYYSKFFTPNNDGYNDTWFIKNSQFEPNFMVEIFDRYGKFITNFYSSFAGWDGNYNGNQMPSSDYWFVIHREDGRTHKGHFALKR